MREPLTLGPLASGGGAVARLTDGRVAFVQGGCPGDTAEIEIVADHGRWLEARIASLIAPSPDRIEPPCPYAGECGGCQWQHVAYPAQAAAKRRIVADALERIGGLDPSVVGECATPSDDLGYRNKVELVVSEGARGLELGYHRRGSDSVVAVDRCLLLPKRFHRAPGSIQGALRYLSGRHKDLGVRRVGLRVASHTGDVEVALWAEPGPFPRKIVARTLSDAIGATGVIRVLTKGPSQERRVSGVEVLSGRGAWSERLGTVRYLVSAPSFFQVNTRGAEALVSTVLAELDPRPTDRVIDLFAGAGTFTVPLAATGAEVAAVESSRHALADLRRNLDGAGLGADIVGGDAAREIADLGGFDLAVVDPPRTGLDPTLIGALADGGARRIAYVSCDPATLARDARAFASRGYTPVTVEPVDLFPQTYHVETVAVFRKGAAGSG